MSTLHNALADRVAKLNEKAAEGEAHLFLSVGLDDLESMLSDSPTAYDYAEVRSALEGIYQDARGAITAPVHHALMSAASRLERLLGIEPGVPAFSRGTPPVCAYCPLPAGHTEDCAPVGSRG